MSKQMDGHGSGLQAEDDLIQKLNSYWRNLSKDPTVDQVLSGLNEVDFWEAMTPYAHASSKGEPYFPRVEAALRALPEEHWDAALAIFSSVIYIPEPILSATHEFLWRAVKIAAREDHLDSSFDAHKIHLMEVDPSGLTNLFAHKNEMQGRLNQGAYPRFGDVQALRCILNDVCSDDPDVSKYGVEQLKIAMKKDVWILLTDKALSGGSLKGDLEKIHTVRELLAEGTSERMPLIYVCAQVITSRAEKEVNDWKEKYEIEGIRVLPAIRLDERAMVGSEECRLFSDEVTHDKVKELCRWFYHERVARDNDLQDIRNNSKGEMIFGYSNTGISLVDYNNTPSNSLPLLWFEEKTERRDDISNPLPPYVGPFPRVHSRSGKEDSRMSGGNLWGIATTDARKKLILERFRNDAPHT